MLFRQDFTSTKTIHIQNLIRIFVLPRPEFVRFPSKIGPKSYSLLSTFVVMEFLQTTQGELGEKIHIRKGTLGVIHFYLMGLRRDHAVYNIHILLFNLRILLRNLTARMLYKKNCLIKFIPNDSIGATTLVKPIEKFPKRELMVTWNKWLVWALRKLAQLRTKERNMYVSEMETILTAKLTK